LIRFTGTDRISTNRRDGIVTGGSIMRVDRHGDGVGGNKNEHRADRFAFRTVGIRCDVILAEATQVGHVAFTGVELFVGTG
jgi:hypothetical protein